MTSDGRRMIRMACKAGMLICLPLTGFVWALPTSGQMLPGVVILTVVSILLGVSAELLASSNETEFNSLSAQYAMDSKRRADELEQRDEKLRQFDRVAALLTEQNNSLRAKLISLQVDLHGLKHGTRQPGQEIPAIEDLPAGMLSAGGTRAR